MSTNNESQCYFVQLQFDSYMDGELNDSQAESFLQHINRCQVCTQEFRYAQTVQDGLLDLPLLDCSEETLDRIRLAANSEQSADEHNSGWWAGLVDWLVATPPVIRYAFPALAIAMIGLITLPLWQPSSSNTPRVATQERPSIESPLIMPANYSPTEIAQAMQELNLAIEYLNQVTERTEAIVGDRFLMTPLRDRLNASFERVRVDANDDLADDHIF